MPAFKTKGSSIRLYRQSQKETQVLHCVQDDNSAGDLARNRVPHPCQAGVGERDAKGAETDCHKRNGGPPPSGGPPKILRTLRCGANLFVRPGAALAVGPAGSKLATKSCRVAAVIVSLETALQVERPRAYRCRTRMLSGVLSSFSRAASAGAHSRWSMLQANPSCRSCQPYSGCSPGARRAGTACQPALGTSPGCSR